MDSEDERRITTRVEMEKTRYDLKKQIRQDEAGEPSGSGKASGVPSSPSIFRETALEPAFITGATESAELKVGETDDEQLGYAMRLSTTLVDPVKPELVFSKEHYLSTYGELQLILDSWVKQFEKAGQASNIADEFTAIGGLPNCSFTDEEKMENVLKCLEILSGRMKAMFEGDSAPLKRLKKTDFEGVLRLIQNCVGVDQTHALHYQVMISSFPSEDDMKKRAADFGDSEFSKKN